MMVDRAREGEYGSKAFDTTPPEAAATTDETIGSSHADATDSGVCLCRENLNASDTRIDALLLLEREMDVHHKDHTEIDKDRDDDIDPPQTKGELCPPPSPRCTYESYHILRSSVYDMMSRPRLMRV